MATINPRVARESALRFKVLSDPTRIVILRTLAEEGELFVGQLCERVGASLLVISHQLRLLRATGLIESRRDGAKMFYSIAGGQDSIVARVLSAVDVLSEPFPKVDRAKRQNV